MCYRAVAEGSNNFKELWKLLRKMGMPFTDFQQPEICLDVNVLMHFNEKKKKKKSQYLPIFLQHYGREFSKLTSSRKNLFSINFVKEYYLALDIPSDSFQSKLTNKEEIFKIVSDVDHEKIRNIDEILGRMLKMALKY